MGTLLFRSISSVIFSLVSDAEIGETLLARDKIAVLSCGAQFATTLLRIFFQNEPANGTGMCGTVEKLDCMPIHYRTEWH